MYEILELCGRIFCLLIEPVNNTQETNAFRRLGRAEVLISQQFERHPYFMFLKSLRYHRLKTMRNIMKMKTKWLILQIARIESRYRIESV